MEDPAGYFEQYGTNIKPGKIELRESGEVKEDPTATKLFPEWSSSDGRTLRAVGKSVNTKKSQVKESGDPFFEYSVMQHIHSLGLPTAIPIARAQHNGTHLIVMEQVPGY